MPPPPTPCTVRPAIRTEYVLARAQMMEPAMSKAVQANRLGRRPKASLREHQSSRVPVLASRYEVPAQKASMSPPPMS